MSSRDTDEETHILFVDDESHLRITVKDFLTFHGYHVDLARSGEQALHKVERSRPDLVILDISMPGMGGMGFLQRIDASHEPPPPVLVLTARTNLRTFFDGVKVAGFLAKPCRKELLLEKVRAILEASAVAVAADETQLSSHVLLGEDDEEVAGVLRRALIGRGHRVTTADSGPAVLEAAPSENPDVVLLKNYLTGLNGGPVASLLRAMPTTSTTPVVVYSEVGAGETLSPLSGAGSRDVSHYVAARDTADIVDAVEHALSSC